MYKKNTVSYAEAAGEFCLLTGHGLRGTFQ